MDYLNYLYIALGGALGATSRYIVSTWIYNKSEYLFPLGTFIVNIIGCFLLGVFSNLTLEKSVSPQIRMMISVGFLGAFTTFSTFSLETLNIIKENNIGIAFLNITLSIIIGLLAVWVGVAFTNFFNREKGKGVKNEVKEGLITIKNVTLKLHNK
ncbi:MAG: fluoride exporter [Clostridia bacterium]|nr:fluoride exporter [Clostridia bacterium]